VYGKRVSSIYRLVCNMFFGTTLDSVIHILGL